MSGAGGSTVCRTGSSRSRIRGHAGNPEHTRRLLRSIFVFCIPATIFLRLYFYPASPSGRSNLRAIRFFRPPHEFMHGPEGSGLSSPRAVMTNLNDLQFFFHVAESGSFTGAARRLELPKSTVSRGLSRLEERLGVRLVERTTRRLLLTEAGEIFLEHCRRVMAEIDQAETEIGTMRGTPRGRLRV